jgi:hypothetical protein
MELSELTEGERGTFWKSGKRIVCREGKALPEPVVLSNASST